MSKSDIIKREVTGLVNFDAAILAIEKAKSVDEVKEIRDKAEACRKYAKQAGASLEGQNMLAEIKIRAERKAGQLLGEMEKHKGGRPKKTPDMMSGVYPPKLEDIGITEKQSERWQLEAELPEEDFERHIETTIEAGKELTSASVQREAKKRRPRPETPPLPEGKFNVIYADPPFLFRPNPTGTSVGFCIPIENARHLCLDHKELWLL